MSKVEAQRRYDQSDKGKARRAKYQATAKGKAADAARVRAWIQRNYEKHQAHNALNHAIARGKLIRPDKCACGRSPVQGHHHDYSKPLDVEWLCVTCHGKAHK